MHSSVYYNSVALDKFKLTFYQYLCTVSKHIRYLCTGFDSLGFVVFSLTPVNFCKTHENES